MWTVAALYRFVELTDLPALQAEIKTACLENDVCGTLLIAPEGINGTIAAPEDGMTQIIALLDRLAGVTQGELKYSYATEKFFLRTKVRIKRNHHNGRAGGRSHETGRHICGTAGLGHAVQTPMSR